MTVAEPVVEAMTDPAMDHPDCHRCRKYEASLKRLTGLGHRALRNVDLRGINRVRLVHDEIADRYHTHLDNHEQEAAA